MMVIRCWTGNKDPDPRPSIYFGDQRLKLQPAQHQNYSNSINTADDSLKSVDDNSIGHSMMQDRTAPVTAHNWRHADRPTESKHIDLQLRIDNSMAQISPNSIE